jgi:hypothetical protein
MKNVNFKSLLLILALSISVVSCDKDDNEPTFKNYLKYEGKYYELKFGYLEYYGSGYGAENSYNFDITLTSVNDAKSTDLAMPTLNYIYFEMFSSSPTELLSGTYNYDSQNLVPFTFDEGEFALDYASSAIYNEVNGGSVIISKSGSTYTIKIDCTDFDGKKITGYFKGELAYDDWSDYKGTKKNRK